MRVSGPSHITLQGCCKMFRRTAKKYKCKVGGGEGCLLGEALLVVMNSKNSKK